MRLVHYRFDFGLLFFIGRKRRAKIKCAYHQFDLQYVTKLMACTYGGPEVHTYFEGTLRLYVSSRPIRGYDNSLLQLLAFSIHDSSSINHTVIKYTM